MEWIELDEYMIKEWIELDEYIIKHTYIIIQYMENGFKYLKGYLPHQS